MFNTDYTFFKPPLSGLNIDCVCDQILSQCFNVLSLDFIKSSHFSLTVVTNHFLKLVEMQSTQSNTALCKQKHIWDILYRISYHKRFLLLISLEATVCFCDDAAHKFVDFLALVYLCWFIKTNL